MIRALQARNHHPHDRHPKHRFGQVHDDHLLHPDQPERTPYVLEALGEAAGPIVAATDYMKVVADQVAPWLSGRLVSLGTDGFGRSDNRQHLRRHFEVDAESIAAAALSRLSKEGKFESARARLALDELAINPDSPDPVRT